MTRHKVIALCSHDETIKRKDVRDVRSLKVQRNQVASVRSHPAARFLLLAASSDWIYATEPVPSGGVYLLIQVQTLGVRCQRNSRDLMWIRVATLQTSLFSPQQLRTSWLLSHFSLFFFSFLSLFPPSSTRSLELRPAVMVRGAVPMGGACVERNRPPALLRH